MARMNPEEAVGIGEEPEDVYRDEMRAAGEGRDLIGQAFQQAALRRQLFNHIAKLAERLVAFGVAAKDRIVGVLALAAGADDGCRRSLHAHVHFSAMTYRISLGSCPASTARRVPTKSRYSDVGRRRPEGSSPSKSVLRNP